MTDAPESSAEEAGDLDALIRRVDPDRWLSSRFIADAQKRADVVAIYAFDYELARAPRVASNPLIGEIRLTWWREALDEIFDGRPVRRHPTAQALAEAVARRGLSRPLLETLIDARYRDLDPSPMDAKEALAWARDTGGVAAEIAAVILEPQGEAGPARAAGTAWALGRKAAEAPVFSALFEKTLASARTAVRKLSPQAFPAAAHAALAGRAGRGELARRLAVTWAVARGRI